MYSKMKTRILENEYINDLMEIIESGFRNIKIKSRLRISFILLTLIPLLVIAVISYQIVSTSIESKTKNSSKQIITQLSYNLNTEIEKIESIVYEISLAPEISETMGTFEKMSQLDKIKFNEKIVNMINSRITLRKEIQSIEIYNKKNYLASTGMIERARNDETNNLLFQEADKMNGKPIWSIIDYTNNSKLLTMSKVLVSKETGENIGYIVMLVDTKFLLNILGTVNTQEDENIMLMNEENIILADKFKKTTLSNEYIKSEIKITKKTLTDGEEITFNKEKQLLIASNIGERAWSVVTLIPYKYINEASVSIRDTIIIILILCMIAAIIISEFITYSISKPLKNLVDLMGIAKNGDFTMQFVDNKEDEISNVIKGFNEMVSNIKSLVSKVHKGADVLYENSSILSSLAQDSKNQTENVAWTIQEISSGSAQQSVDIQDGVNQLTELSQTIDVVGEFVEDMSNVASDTKELSHYALDLVDILNKKAVMTSDVSEKIIFEINSLNNYMHEVNKISKIILAINDQIKLLSINASLQAAKVGGSFNVIAKEIKKLSEKSRNASRTISRSISNVQKQMNSTIEKANEAQDIIEDQRKFVTKTHDSFVTISTSMTQFIAKTEVVKSSIEDVISSKNKTFDNFVSISAVSEEVASNTQEVSDNTRRQIEGVVELEELSNKLTYMSETLTESISIFKF